MADDDEDPAPKTGVVIQKGTPLPLVPPTGQERTLYRLLRRLSTFPFFNRRYVESLKSAKEVFDAKSDLGQAIGRHQEIRDRLKHFGTVLETKGEERQRELYEEKERRRAAENIFKFEEEMQDEKNRQAAEALEITGMQQRKTKAALQKEIDEIAKPPPPPEQEPKKKTTRGRSAKQKARDDAQKKYESEIARIEKDKKLSAEAKEDLKKSAAKDREVELEKIDKMP